MRSVDDEELVSPAGFIDVSKVVRDNVETLEPVDVGLLTRAISPCIFNHGN